MRISKQEARRLALHAQGLDNSWQLSPGKEGVAEVVERLGYVQIDTISVVQRAHHHTVWSRHDETRVGTLYDLLAEHDRIFEYWAHAAAYVPLSDYRYYLPRMRAYARSERCRKQLSEHAEAVEHVRERIRAEGPLGSADFKPPEGYVSGTWWNWKPAKRALDSLFTAGELMIAARRNFQRIYDLTERVLPAHVDTTEPTQEEVQRFFARRVLRSHGLVNQHVLRGQVDRPAFEGIMREWVATGEVIEVEVEGLEGEPYYALPEMIDRVGALSSGAPLVHILSPFDNAAIWRPRLSKLFDFEYSIECYLPQEKRVHGYFVLPVLWGDRFVARLDAKADRKPRVLILQQLTFEPWASEVEDADALLAALALKIAAFARFNDCDHVHVRLVEPASWREPLERALQDALIPFLSRDRSSKPRYT